jgi:hypothetical protein
MYTQIYAWNRTQQTLFKTFPTRYAQVHLSAWHINNMSTWSTTKTKVSTQYNLQIYIVPPQWSFTTTYN